MGDLSCDVLHVGSVPVSLGAKKHSGLSHVVWGLTRHQRQYSDYSVAIAARGAYYVPYQCVKGIDIFGVTLSPRALLHAVNVAGRHWKELDLLEGKDRIRFGYALYFLSTIFGRLECRLLHIHHITNMMSLAARYLDFEGPVVAHIHSNTHIIEASSKAEREYRVDTSRRLLEQVDQVVHVSRFVRRQGWELGVRHGRPECVLYNGIDRTKFRSKEGKERYSICFVGAFLTIKGIERLLEALRILRPIGLPVCWVGEGPLEDDIRQASYDLNAEFETPGLVTNREARRFMRFSEVLVVPSRSESFGQVYLEALVEGTPVVGFGPIIREFQDLLHSVQDNRWLFPYDHDVDGVEDLAGLIQKARAQEYCRDEHRRICDEIEENFGWRSRVSRVEQVYERLL